jgi:hypothetical protein
MDKDLIKKNAKIRAGNYTVSIGTYKTTDVALISNNTGEFVKIKDIRKGGKLEKVKRKFSRWLNSKDTFTFEFMQPDTVKELVLFLKK